MKSKAINVKGTMNASGPGSLDRKPIRQMTVVNQITDHWSFVGYHMVRINTNRPC